MTYCDYSMAGVLLRDPHGAVLLMRGRGPRCAGWAGITGHACDHGGRDETAVVLVQQVTGVRLTSATLDKAGGFQGMRGNPCGRPQRDGDDRRPGPVSHAWRGWAVDLGERPDVTLPATEVSGAMWATVMDLGYLLGRTLAMVHGMLPAREWQARPGIEPVWVRWLVMAGVLDVPKATLDTIEKQLCGPLSGT